MNERPKILIVSTPQSKSSDMEKIFRELKNKGYCLVETKLIDDTITGVNIENIIVDDFLVRWSVAIIADT